MRISVAPLLLILDFVSPITSSYLLHPYGFLSTAALSLTMLDNFVILAALFFALKGDSSSDLFALLLSGSDICHFTGNFLLAPLFVAYAAYTSFYPVVLIVPVVMLLKHNKVRLCLLIFLSVWRARSLLLARV